MDQPRADNELVPASDAAKPLFSASQLRVTPHRTAEDIQRDIRDERFAEMTPGQAGEAGEDSRVLSELRETAADLHAYRLMSNTDKAALDALRNTPGQPDHGD